MGRIFDAMFRLRRRVYCDNNATTVVSPAVRKRVNRVLARAYGNPSSLYKIARDSAAILSDARRTVAAAINAEPAGIVFTGGASEANNAILKAAAEHFFPRKKRIVSTPIEHASVMKTLEYLGGKGIEVACLPVDRMGRVDLRDVERMVDDRTFLVCCMLANNETGVIQDVRRIAAVAHARGALAMSDCVQALGKIPVDVRTLDVDYASFSAHKIHGPKGVGALYVREGRPFAPLIHGGHQESGMRAGTEGLHNIAGFAAACESLEVRLARAGDVAALRNRFVEGLRRVKPDLKLNTPPEGALPNTASVTFPGMGNAVFMAMLDFHGIAVSAGSACNTGEDRPSHVLTALGLTDDEARQTIRFSLSADAREKDVRYLLRVIGDCVSGRTPPVSAISPAQVDENLLMDERTFIVDVRHWYDKKLLKGLPNAHEFPLFTIQRHLKSIPRDRNVIVSCQAGYDGPIVAYYLRSKGYRNVGFIMTGVLGWKLAKPELYRRLAGTNVHALGDRS